MAILDQGINHLFPVAYLACRCQEHGRPPSHLFPRALGEFLGRLLRIVIPDDNFPVIGPRGKCVGTTKVCRENVIRVLLVWDISVKKTKKRAVKISTNQEQNVDIEMPL